MKIYTNELGHMTNMAAMLMMSLSLTTRQPNGSFASKRFYLLTSKNT